MNLTIDQCIGITNALSQIKSQNNVSFLFAWHLDDIIKELKTHVDRGQQEQLKLLKEYGSELPDKPGNYMVNPEKRTDYLKAIEPIMAHVVEVKILPFELKEFRREKVIVPASVNMSFLRLVIDDSK